MTYSERFGYERRTPSWDVYGWLGWTIYWDSEAKEGKLYSPTGTFITDTDDVLRDVYADGFEMLAAVAVRRNEFGAA